MKNLLLPIFAILLISTATSCKKDYICKCVEEYTYKYTYIDTTYSDYNFDESSTETNSVLIMDAKKKDAETRCQYVETALSWNEDETTTDYVLEWNLVATCNLE